MARGQSVPETCPDCHNAATSTRAAVPAHHAGVTGPRWGDLPYVRRTFVPPRERFPDLDPHEALIAVPEFVDCGQCDTIWLANEDQRFCPVCAAAVDPTVPDSDSTSWQAVTCVVCRGVVLDLVASPTVHALCPRCDTGYVHRGPGSHGLGRALDHDCRCETCLEALDLAWGYVDRRVAGETLDDIGASVDPKPLSRERVRQITAKVAPWAPWDAAENEAKTETALVERVRTSTIAGMNTARSCRTCGGSLPADASSRQKFCRTACREAYDSLRYTIDEERREMQRLRTAQWVLENPEGKTPEALRYARKVVAGTNREYEGRRWLIEGSASWDNAVEAMVKSWPIADELPRPIKRQIAEHLGWDLSDFPAPPPDDWSQHAVGKGPYADVLTLDFLESAYTDEGRSASDIADEVGCNRQTVLTALHRHGIPTRTGNLVTYGEALTRKFLEREYVESERSAVDIADDVGCSSSTVYAALRRHSIPTRSGADRPPSAGGNGRSDWTGVLTRDFLLRQYVGKGLSGREIAQEVGCHHTTVYTALARYGIERHGTSSERTSWEDVFTEEFLRSEYLDHGKSGPQIAGETGANPSVVYAWMERHGISRRKGREGPEGRP